MGDVIWCALEKKVRETERAVLLQLENELDPRWIPRSCIENMDDEVVGISTWFAEREGIEGDRA